MNWRNKLQNIPSKPASWSAFFVKRTYRFELAEQPFSPALPITITADFQFAFPKTASDSSLFESLAHRCAMDRGVTPPLSSR